MIDRRTVLKGITALPILGVVGGLATALLSYLRPTLHPLELPKAELPRNEPYEAATLDEFKNDYDFKAFEFVQRTVEYTARGEQETRIPGFIVRIPNGRLPATVGETSNNRLGYAVVEQNGETYSLVVVSRICAHLGCIFEFHTQDVVCSRFNYCAGQNPMFSCPCHLSVYNPVESQPDAAGQLLPGHVVSGPAPRPPFPFQFKVEGDKIIILGYA